MKSFGAEEKEIARFDKNLTLFLNLSYRKGLNNAYFYILTTLIVSINVLVHYSFNLGP